MAKANKTPWVSTYDSGLDRWVSWDEMGQDWYREHQARRMHHQLNLPMFWIAQSNALHRSALCVWNESAAHPEELMRSSEHQKVALMLGGMSIECAIKAQWISSCDFPLDAGEQKKIFSGAHDLASLARSAGIRTNASDRKVLALLSMHVRWLGRYPTPKVADEFVRHMLDRSIPRGKEWDAYLSIREKLGKSVSRTFRRWNAVPKKGARAKMSA
jgi:hypothetical protein